jgi:hypothetical protein
MKKPLGFPDGNTVLKAAVQFNPRVKRSYKLLMVQSRARGVYVVLKDIMEHWPIEYRREVEVAVKKYIEDCRANGWSEKEK